MMARVPLADTTNLPDQKRAFLPHYLNAEPQDFNFEHQISHLAAYESNNLGALKDKDTSARTNIRIMSSGQCLFTSGTMTCNCVQGQYITYPESGRLNEQCQICFHPSSAHKDASQTAGKSPSLKIWIENLMSFGDILRPKENHAANVLDSLVVPGKRVRKSLIYAC